MKNFTNPDSSNRKVTLSCRVLPEQKLMIAERAKQLEMSVAQYIEAKILQKDNLHLEKNIQRQQLEIERLQTELKQLQEAKAIVEERHLQSEEKLNALSMNRQKSSHSPNNSIKLSFIDEAARNAFSEKLKKLADKHQLQTPRRALEMCIEYTLKNDAPHWFLQTVRGFVKNYFHKTVTTKTLNK